MLYIFVSPCDLFQCFLSGFVVIQNLRPYQIEILSQLRNVDLFVPQVDTPEATRTRRVIEYVLLIGGRTEDRLSGELLIASLVWESHVVVISREKRLFGS